jgi:hypothetical protein
VSGRGQGRRAALPPAGFRPQQRLGSGQDRLVVRFVPEDGNGETKDYDFSNLPISPALRTAVAQAFAARTKPGARLRSTSSADRASRMAVSFAAYLNTLVRPPSHPGAVTSAQVQGWLQQRSHLTRVMKELGDLKALLKKVPGITPEFAAAMHQPHTRPKDQPSTSTYSRDEFRRILSAARFDVRRAAERIRAGREHR